ncbi:hypothetical protein GQ600_12821 [Phytophthora cactorum]|nr:hypothetical protein GQ600_12821 [Phytophthora cactorum]
MDVLPSMKRRPNSECRTMTSSRFRVKSKGLWVRHIAKRDITKKKALATYIQNGTISVFLCTLAPGFAAYEMAIRFKETDEELLKQCNRRFVALREKLHEWGLQLRADSAPCKIFIKGCVKTLQRLHSIIQRGFKAVGDNDKSCVLNGYYILRTEIDEWSSGQSQSIVAYM